MRGGWQDNAQRFLAVDRSQQRDREDGMDVAGSVGDVSK